MGTMDKLFDGSNAHDLPAVDFDGIKAKVTSVAMEAAQDVFHRMPWDQEIVMSDGRRGKILKFVEPRLNEETGKPEFGFDIAGDGWHLEFFVRQTGWGGAP